MNREEFMDYIRDNYDVSAEALRIIDNILWYAATMLSSEEERFDFLNLMFDGTIGLSEREIRKINL